MWRNACGMLVCPGADEAWQQIVETSASDSMWHSLRNCVAYQVMSYSINWNDITFVGRMTFYYLFLIFLQAGVWQNLLIKGIPDVMYPAAFKLAIVLRHTPSDLVVNFLGNMLHLHPQSVSTYWFSYHLPSHLIFWTRTLKNLIKLYFLARFDSVRFSLTDWRWSLLRELWGWCRYIR